KCFNLFIIRNIRYLIALSFIIRSTTSLIGTEGGDSCGNSACLKPPQSGLLEEAEAVPAASVRLQWKSTVLAHFQVSGFTHKFYMMELTQIFALERISRLFY